MIVSERPADHGRCPDARAIRSASSPPITSGHDAEIGTSATPGARSRHGDMALRALCLCDGYGGFELGFRLAGLDVQTVCRCERDSYAASVLVARMEEALLDRAPIWDDLETFDGAAWRGRVDIVTAGFPCQPFSKAGLRGGVDDERWIWPGIARIIADVGPSYIFLENVPGLVRGGLPHVLADLAELGFDAEWGMHSALAVGAPHNRERFWLLAHADGDGFKGFRFLDAGDQRDADRPGGEDVADTTGIGDAPRFGPGARPGGWVEGSETRGRDMADAEGRRLSESTGDDAPGLPGSDGLRRFPPHPDDDAGWDEYRRQGGPEPSVRRGPDGRPPEMVDALHLGGNGLVPLAAANAFIRLADRLTQPPQGNGDDH